jgi:ADP-ribosyltransferase exoenzyme
MKELIKLARLRLKDEIAIINKYFPNTLTELTVEEKAVIYWYSNGGYEGLNHILRESKGKSIPPFGILLDLALSKLPSYNFVVYRGLIFTSFRIEKYREALENETLITENAFTSTSTRRETALQFGQIILRIFPKNGKSIENISKFVTEREVLLTKGSQFMVLEIKNENNYHLITLEEI